MKLRNSSQNTEQRGELERLWFTVFSRPTQPEAALALGTTSYAILDVGTLYLVSAAVPERNSPIY